MLNKQYLEEVEARLNAAEEGPWRIFDDIDEESGRMPYNICSIGGEHDEDCPKEGEWKDNHCHYCIGTVYEPRNGEFITHAREDVGRLLKYIKSLEKFSDQMHRAAGDGVDAIMDLYKLKELVAEHRRLVESGQAETANKLLWDKAQTL